MGIKHSPVIKKDQINLVHISLEWEDLLYFPARKTHCDFFIRILEKNNDECILILVIYWKKTGLLHTKINNHSIIMPDLMIWKQISLSHDKDVV
jgi:hypothetical protein